MISFSIKIPESMHNDLLELTEEFCSNKTSVVRLAIKRLAEQELPKFRSKRPPQAQITEGVM
jgi:predicted transcriptional regulator